MKKLSHHIILILFSFLPLLPAMAQEDAEYTMEIGGGLGGLFGVNDANTKLFGQPGFQGSGTFRYVINRRSAVKLSLGYASLSGNTKNVDDFMPAVVGQAGSDRLQYEFSTSLIDFSALYELHFLPYGYYKGYQGLHRLVPYLQLGLGAVYSSKGKAFAPTIPMGFGLKYRVAPRLNLGFEWRMHFTTSDKLEGLEAPHGIKSQMFKNKDHYNVALFTLTYSFSEKCPTCNKDEW